MSCKMSNLIFYFVTARDARAVKHKNSISSHMNDFQINATSTTSSTERN